MTEHRDVMSHEPCEDSAEVVPAHFFTFIEKLQKATEVIRSAEKFSALSPSPFAPASVNDYHRAGLQRRLFPRQRLLQIFLRD